MSTVSNGTLYLIPSSLGDSAPIDALPEATLTILRRLDHLIVETPKQARRFLKSAGVPLKTHTIHFQILNEHTPAARMPELLAPVLQGADAGVLSDAGCPGVGDPGARLVRLAHTHGVAVVPLVGPSAVLLALMGSGLNGQRFAFHGYLPVDTAACAGALRGLEQRSRSLGESQIVIEAPYRNDRLLGIVVEACHPDTLLCIATDLTLPTQSIATQSIGQWRRLKPRIDRRPTVFVFCAGE